MIAGEVLMDILSYHRQGFSLRKISRLLGIHRETVKKYIDEPQGPRYGKVKRKDSILAPFHQMIDDWLAQDDYRATWIFQRIKDLGYAGGYDTVKDFVRSVTLPPTLTLEKLRGPHASVPHNPLLAEPMYLTKYIERMGTGIRDMIRRCKKAGLGEPEIRLDAGFFVLTIRRQKPESGAQSRAQSEAILRNLGKEPLSAAELAVALGLQSKTGAFKRTLQELVDNGMIEYTIPGKPTSRLQKYRLTEKGRSLLEQLERGRGASI